MSNATELPEWALVYARGAIRCGFAVPDIEQTLVKKGLTPSQAVETVNHCFDQMFEADSRTRKWRAVRKGLSRWLSFGLVASICALLWWQHSAEAGVRIFLFFAFPLACVWFAEAFGAYVGSSFSAGLGHINRPTPGCFVAFGGWLFLLLFGVPLLLSLLGL